MTETTTIDPNAQAVLDALGEGWSFGAEPDEGMVEFTNGDITVGVGLEHLSPDHTADIAATIAHAASADPDTLDEGDTGGPEDGDDEDAVEGDDEEHEEEEEE